MLNGNAKGIYMTRKSWLRVVPAGDRGDPLLPVYFQMDYQQK
jgi:hypothetical protein